MAFDIAGRIRDCIARLRVLTGLGRILPFRKSSGSRLPESAEWPFSNEERTPTGSGRCRLKPPEVLDLLL